MKKFTLILLVFVASLSTKAQTIAGDYLDINNVKARVNANSYIFNDPNSGYTQQFEVPKYSGTHTIYSGQLFVGGIDASAILKTSTTFWPGPLSSFATTDSTTISMYNKVWKLNQCDIDAYMNWYNAGQPGPNPIDSIAMNTFVTWPTANPTGGSLAPFFDSNTNGIYDPYAGDYPLIKGDQAIFFVFNDIGITPTPGYTRIGIEVQAMIYGYSCPNDSALYNTVFLNYNIINKSSFRIDSTFIGNWTDLDIGSASDDFIGCDVTRGTYYGYNGDLIDDNPPAGQNTYGANPPA